MYAPSYPQPQQPYGAPQQGAFPPTIGQAPRERRVDETFGWFPGAVSAGALLFVVGRILSLLMGDSISIEDTEFIAGGVAVWGLFAFWEIFRRTRPTSLVVIGGQIGIYRKGQLDGVVGFGQLTHFRLSIINTARECIFFGLATLGGGFGLLGTLSEGHLAAAFYALGAFVFGGAGLASCLWSRAMCVHYWIPKGGGTETVVMRRSDLNRIGWPTV